MLADIIETLGKDVSTINGIVVGRQTHAYLSAPSISVDKIANTVWLTAYVGLSPEFPKNDKECDLRGKGDFLLQHFYAPAVEMVKQAAGQDYKVEWSSNLILSLNIRPKHTSPERLLEEEAAIKRVYGANVPAIYFIPTPEKAHKSSSKLLVATH